MLIDSSSGSPLRRPPGGDLSGERRVASTPVWSFQRTRISSARMLRAKHARRTRRQSEGAPPSAWDRQAMRTKTTETSLLRPALPASRVPVENVKSVLRGDPSSPTRSVEKDVRRPMCIPFESAAIHSSCCGEDACLFLDDLVFHSAPLTASVACNDLHAGLELFARDPEFARAAARVSVVCGLVQQLWSLGSRVVLVVRLECIERVGHGEGLRSRSLCHDPCWLAVLRQRRSKTNACHVNIA
jgi:hypothetical protein